MKKLALAFALLLGTSGPLLADTAAKDAGKAATPRTVTADRPVLDQTKTRSIRQAQEPADTAAPAKRRVRSGIEINPWIVPSFR
ncbi:hypothetical protein [Kumtagia ephedrae]|uniref:Uncharacterized protein n=1 Tax=Kumtagia ephedrae TaxID=2116701 RepID=A0A2P7S4B0_9HYPH|nr:hypothetical protein [Mesorhizobium ephedrae]PSJ57281.1 hypothetical protein C7I84_18735 [Mesorhizobium ephedrae]